MTVVFMGSPDFAVPTLEVLADADDVDIVCVVSQPDRPSGRGRRMTPTAVKREAERRALPVLDMSKANYADVVAKLSGLEPQFVVVAAFGVILKKDLLTLPTLGCVNLHASLLPRYRGVSPIQAALLAGEKLAGVTTIMMDEGIDTGDILLELGTEVQPQDTAGTLTLRLADIGALLVLETLRGLRDGDIGRRPQDNALATYTKKIRKQHGAIDWSQAAAQVDRHIRAMSPWPNAFTMLEGKRVIISSARLADGVGPFEPGRIRAVEPLTVETGDGVLVIDRVKVPGSKDMDAAAFVAGHRPRTGQVLTSG